jgi:2-phospho-L-lactate guanylyltransferase (CobY/MobA/RfbA family)
MPVPLVPVKALAAAKGRLGPLLSPLERRLLAIAMFEDVVAALQATPGLGVPLVVSPDRELWRRAEAIGCRVVEEPAGSAGLNAALEAAAARAGEAGLEPATFAPRFGPGSAARHLSVPGAVRVEDPGLAMDVDTVEDLRRVAGRVDPDTVTGRRLRDLRLPARLAGNG